MQGNDTPLHDAVSWGYDTIAVRLLQCPLVDPNARNTVCSMGDNELILPRTTTDLLPERMGLRPYSALLQEEKQNSLRCFFQVTVWTLIY